MLLSCLRQTTEGRDNCPGGWLPPEAQFVVFGRIRWGWIRNFINRSSSYQMAPPRFIHKGPQAGDTPFPSPRQQTAQEGAGDGRQGRHTERRCGESGGSPLSAVREAARARRRSRSCCRPRGTQPVRNGRFPLRIAPPGVTSGCNTRGDASVPIRLPASSRGSTETPEHAHGEQAGK